MSDDAELCEQIFQAVLDADSPIALRLIDQACLQGLDLEANWPAGDPPLVLAAKKTRDAGLLSALLQARCERDARSATGETALHCVVGHWDEPADAVRLLLSAGCPTNVADQLNRQTPLHVLAKRCAQPRKSSSGGTSPTKIPSSLVTTLEVLAKVSDANCQDNRKRTALHNLVNSHCTDSEPFLILLKHGAKLGVQNERGETPLLVALERNALFAAELLLEESAKTVLSNEWLCQATQYGETALHVAARKDLQGIVASMLTVHSGPTFTRAQDLNGDTALHLAAGRGHLEVVTRLLMTESVEVNARNKKGLAPLHVAVESGFIHVVKALLQKPDCDVTARTTDERRSSPVDLAQQEYRRRSQPEMSDILKQEVQRRSSTMIQVIR